MDLKESIKKLEKSAVFKGFRKDNPEFFLAHAFTIIDRSQNDWQIGYYGRKQDKVVVFIVGDEITKSPEEEVFKKPEDRVRELRMKKVKLTLEQAVEKANELVKLKYRGELVTKIIAIIQNLESEIYNLTLVSQSMNIINVKIDASSGSILHESRDSILSLKKKD